MKNLSSITDNEDIITKEYVSNKENTSNKVTSLSSSSTDTQYPSAKCVYDTLLGNVNYTLGEFLKVQYLSDKVTSLSSQSTNNQYPSAKCVYDHINTIVGNIESLLSEV